jgi:hypothetical protein
MSVGSKKIFVIRRSFLLPLGLLLLETLVLLVVCLVQRQPLAKALILAVLILPIAGLFVESQFRKLVLEAEGLTAKRLFREKMIRFAEVTELDTVMVRSRVYLTLCAGEDFLILSNAYARFPALVGALVAQVPDGTVTAATAKMASAPPSKKADIISCWLGVALLVYILYVQF